MAVSSAAERRDPLPEEVSTVAQSPGVARVLCLGNDLLADDGLGPAVREALDGRVPAGVEVIHTDSSGLGLLDHLIGASRLVVVDAIQTGRALPGTVSRLEERDLAGVPGPAPHYVGLLEALTTGRYLGLAVPAAVTLIAVEVADCLTLGGDMHPAVRSAIPEVVRLVTELLEDPG
jgi:hydrogenase maturation protease